MSSLGSNLATVLLATITSLGCGSPPAVDQPVVQRQSPEKDILAIGTTWEARSEDNGLKSEPSKISVFTVRELSTLELVPDKQVIREGFLREETFRMRDGRSFNCRSEGILEVQVRYFLKGDEPAVEVTRPDVELARHCDQPGFPEPVIQLSSTPSSFLLRDERLVGFAPPLEKRSYVPVQ